MSKIMAYLQKHEDSADVTAELLDTFAGHERAVKSALARSLERKGVDRVFFAEPEFDAARFLYHYRALGFEIIYEGIE